MFREAVDFKFSTSYRRPTFRGQQFPRLISLKSSGSFIRHDRRWNFVTADPHHKLFLPGPQLSSKFFGYQLSKTSHNTVPVATRFSLL